MVPLFAYPIAETELGNIQSPPGFKKLVCVSSSHTFISRQEVTLLHTLPTVYNLWTVVGEKNKKIIYIRKVECQRSTATEIIRIC